MQEKILTLGMRSNNAPTNPNPLVRAALDDNPSAVPDLVKQGVDINAKHTDDWTALHISSAHNHPQFVDVLLEYGADSEIRVQNGVTALHMSATNGHDKVVEVLLRHGARLDAKEEKNGFTALHLATRRGRKETLQVLIDAMVKQDMFIDEPANNGETALESACRGDNVECVKILASAGANVDAMVDSLGRTPLMNAATTDKDQIAQALLNAGADVDRVHSTGMTAVEIAAFSGNLKVLQTLISGGANLEIMDRNGYTPLRAAFAGEHPEAAILLLQQRVRVNTTWGDHKDTALHLAVSRSYRDVVEALIAKGADVDACDSDGDTPLQWAVESGKLELAKILLRHGAQINKRNEKTGKVVLYWAVKCGHVSMTELLLANRADTSLIDLNEVQKKQSTDEEEFETCKILIETASCSGSIPELPPQEKSSQSAITIPTESECKLPADTPEPERQETNAHGFVRYEVLDIPSQSAAENTISQLISSVKHNGVMCDGPLCKDKPENIQGIRFKCTWCENVDFCSSCIASFHNNHDATHVFIRCLLPTQFHTIKEIDHNSKRLYLEACGDPSVTIDDMRHMVYALPDEQSIQSQLDLGSRYHPAYAEVEQLLQNSSPAIFPVVRSASDGFIPGNVRNRDIINQGDTRPGGIAYYKIDEGGNVRVKNYHKDEPETTPKEDDILVHHPDPDLLLRSLTGELKYYDYSEDRTFHKWAWEHRLVTRVIDIKPGNFDDKLEIEIRVVDLDTWPAYEALSYTWKETAYERGLRSSWSRENTEAGRRIARAFHGVYCSDGSGKERYLQVNCGLRDALKRLRDTAQTKTYWIDQLSINQADHGERKFQVSGMRFFYNRARQVTLWVGEDEENTSEVFAIFRKIAQDLKNQGHFPDPNQMLANTQLGLPPLDSPVWKSVLDFFNRPVFTRCWVIQEVIMGQNVVVLCGKLAIHWADFSRAAQSLAQRPWLEKLAPKKQSTDAKAKENEIGQGGLSNLVMMKGMRDDFHALKENSLESLLFFTGVFQATDPRDKIYSVLGIRSARNTSRGDPNDIEADYQKSVEDVFLNAARVCIMQSSALTICGINNGPSSKKIKDLPSWVPDFTATALSSATSLCRPQPLNPYNARGEDIPLVAAWPYEDRPDLLVTSSCKLETITSVSQHVLSPGENSLPAVIIEWTKMASTIGPQYPTGEFAPDVFCRTCLVDTSGPLRQSPMPESFHLPLCRFYQACYLNYLFTECEISNRPMDSVLPETCNAVLATLIKDVDDMEAASGTSDETRPSTTNSTTPPIRSTVTAGEPSNKNESTTPPIDATVTDAMFLACSNRRFFVTANGFFGLGSSDTQVGDEVHVLSGTKVPFVLRKLEAGNGNGNGNTEPGSGTPDNERSRDALEIFGEDGLGLYTMVGETYVHGYMQGQVAHREDVEWEGICIC